ncbi:UrcA family protein [Sphingomonas sp. UYAg733]
MKMLFTLVALAAATIVAPVSAQETVPGNLPYRVSHADLDLRTDAGVRSLDRRIDHVVGKACGWASDFDLAGQNEIRRCRKQAVAAAAAQRNRAIDDVRQPDMASTEVAR